MCIIRLFRKCGFYPKHCPVHGILAFVRSAKYLIDIREHDCRHKVSGGERLCVLIEECSFLELTCFPRRTSVKEKRLKKSRVEFNCPFELCACGLSFAGEIKSKRLPDCP